jgi:hypothetical protein
MRHALRLVTEREHSFGRSLEEAQKLAACVIVVMGDMLCRSVEGGKTVPVLILFVK